MSVLRFSFSNKLFNNLSWVIKTSTSFLRDKHVESWMLSKVRKPSKPYFEIKLLAWSIIELPVGLK